MAGVQCLGVLTGRRSVVGGAPSSCRAAGCKHWRATLVVAGCQASPQIWTAFDRSEVLPRVAIGVGTPSRLSSSKVRRDKPGRIWFAHRDW